MLTDGLHKERALLSRVAEGDEDAFKQLFEIYLPLLEASLVRLLKNKTIVNDVLQDVFLRIWLYRNKAEGVENPRSWVLRIAYTCAFSFLGKEKKYIQHLNALAGKQSDIFNETPAEALYYKTVKETLTAIVKQLPPQQRKMYQLHREQGMRIQEIAQLLQLSPQSVKNTLGRAMTTIQQEMEAKGYLSILPAAFYFFYKP